MQCMIWYDSSIFCQLKATEDLIRAYTVDSVKLQVKNVGACRIFILFLLYILFRQMRNLQEQEGVKLNELDHGGGWK